MIWNSYIKRTSAVSYHYGCRGGDQNKFKKEGFMTSHILERDEFLSNDKSVSYSCTHSLTHSYLFFCNCVSAECMIFASPNLYPTHLGIFVCVCPCICVGRGSDIYPSHHVVSSLIVFDVNELDQAKMFCALVKYAVWISGYDHFCTYHWAHKLLIVFSCLVS